MDIKADINWIHQEIDKVKDPTFLQKLKHLLQSINSTKTESKVDYNIAIEKALESIKNGDFYTEEQAQNISKKWLKK